MGLGLLPYFPLASGMLSGKYSRDHLPEGTRLATAPYAVHHGSELPSGRASWRILQEAWPHAARTGISWLAANPINSSVIAGATETEQLEQNVKAVDWDLTPDDLAEIDRLTGKSPV